MGKVIPQDKYMPLILAARVAIMDPRHVDNFLILVMDLTSEEEMTVAIKYIQNRKDGEVPEHTVLNILAVMSILLVNKADERALRATWFLLVKTLHEDSGLPFDDFMAIATPKEFKYGEQK